MKRSFAARLLAGTILSTSMMLAPAWAQDEDDTETAGGIDLITVTAQRTEESLLDVPIAVSAFDARALDARQIETFSDLQFNTPNVTFTKGNFTGSNFQIRGIGSTLVAASSDTGVGLHVNDVYLNSPRIFEIEYFDLERVEVLRGPQGTLYGRNATGGTINVITARPRLDEFEVSVDGQYGNFDHKRVKGHVNVPIIEDVLGVRIAGIFLERDGYSENIFDGDDIDGRDQWSIRGSIRWQPTERTTVDIIGSYFEENSNRVRSAKQLCHRDPTAVLGCLPDKLALEATNLNSTLAGVLTSTQILGPLGLADLNGPGGNVNAVNPRNLREVNLDFQPIYESDETFVMAQIEHEITDALTLTVLGAYQDTLVFSEQDYNSIFSNEPFVAPAALAAFPAAGALYADGLAPISDINAGNSGVVGGAVRSRDAFLEGYDRSFAESQQYSVEVRLASSFDGPLNFLVAGYYLDFENETDYYVVANGLDYFSVVGGAATVADGIGLVAPFFNSETDLYTLESYAAFGEVYYDVTENFTLTAGLRYTVDEKFVRDRQILFDTGVPLGTVNANPALAAVDKDPATDGLQEFREDDVTFREVTGRFVAEWMPQFDFTDETLIYFSYARGYKSGGINPPIDPALFPNTPAAFDPEFINAYEIGTKNQLFEGRLQANLTGFYYDYSGLQVSRIVNRTSINENINASIWGLEGEFVAAPIENLLFNLNVSYLNTEIGNSTSVDGRDPTDGRDDVTLIKDIQNASNCIIEHNGLPDPVSLGLLDTFAAAGIPYLPQDTPGIASAAVSTCEGLPLFFEAAGLPYTITDGSPVDLSGNELQNSPSWTVTFGGQYTHPFAVEGYEMQLVGRFDYYIQDDFYARIFNREPIDRIEGWDQLNLSLTLEGPERQWFVRGFVQNVFNDDNITGHYFTDPSSGNFTNVFVLEPRLYGINVGYTF